MDAAIRVEVGVEEDEVALELVIDVFLQQHCQAALDEKANEDREKAEEGAKKGSLAFPLPCPMYLTSALSAFAVNCQKGAVTCQPTRFNIFRTLRKNC